MRRATKIVVLFFFLAVGLPGAYSQEKEKSVKPVFDEALAKKLGADQYGMKPYVLVILTTGPAKITDSEELQRVFAGHLGNIGRLASEGKLVVAGPFEEAGAKRGIFILSVESTEEAEKLVKSDPGVIAGVFSYELYKWYGSAALRQVHEIHQTIQKDAIP